MNIETQSEFGNLAPVIDVVNIAGCLNPKLVDDETVEVIAESTGTSPDLVQCVVEAVDEVNSLIGDGEDPDEVIKNFSNFINDISDKYVNTNFSQSKELSAYGISKVVFAMHDEDLKQFDASTLTDYVTSFVPANFDLMKSAIESAQSSRKVRNFSRTKANGKHVNMSLAALGKSLSNVATKVLLTKDQALKAGAKAVADIAKTPAGQAVKTAVAEVPAVAEKVITTVPTTVKSATSAVAQQAPQLLDKAVVGGKAALQAVKAEMPALKEAVKDAGSKAGSLLKDIIKHPLSMGFKSEVANAGRLKDQKVLAEKAVKLMNQTKGAAAYDLSNATLEVDIIRDSIKNTKDALGVAAKHLKNGEISQEFYNSLQKDFGAFVKRSAKNLTSIEQESINKLKGLATANDDFIKGTSELLAQFNQGKVTEEALVSTFNRLLKPMQGSFKADAVQTLTAASDKKSAVKSLLNEARSQAADYQDGLDKILKNFKSVSEYTNKELLALGSQELPVANPNTFLNKLRALPDKTRQLFVLNGVKSCQPAVKSASALEKNYNTIITSAKSAMGKTAAALGMSAIPAGMIYYGLTRDEDKALRWLVEDAEALKIQIDQLENQIQQTNAQLANEKQELASKLPRGSLKADTATGYVFLKNFARQNYALPAPIAAIGKKLLFPIAPAILWLGSTALGVELMRDKISRIQYRESELESEITQLAIKRNDLNMRLAEIEKTLKRYHMGRDVLGYNS